MEIRIFLDELGCEAIEQAKQIMCNQDLPVAARARANPNDWDGNTLGDQLREPGRHRFQHDAKAACLFEDHSIFHESFGGNRSLALSAESAELMDGLRRETEMPHDRNPG